MKQGGGLDCLYISIYLICCHSDLMVQLAGLLIFASCRQQEDVACRGHIEDRLAVE